MSARVTETFHILGRMNIAVRDGKPYGLWTLLTGHGRSGRLWLVVRFVGNGTNGVYRISNGSMDQVTLASKW